MNNFKKLLTITTIIFLMVSAATNAFAYERYTVLKTTNDYSPVRTNPHVNATRYTHLKKDVDLYARPMGVNSSFYEVNLGLQKPYYIEKKYVEVVKNVARIPTNTAKKIVAREDDEFATLKIKFDKTPPYQTSETPGGNLDLNLFNTTNSSSLRRVKKNHYFKILKNKNAEMIKIKYNTKYPLVGYGVEKSGDTLTFKVRKFPTIDYKAPLNGIKIVIDPGHGGSDPGAVANGLLEKDINLQISLKLKDFLEQTGAKVYMTRDDDSTVGLYERVDFAKSKDAFILLSVHQNSLPNPKEYEKKHGTGVYYYNDQSKPLARVLQEGMLTATGFRDDGVNFASFALNRPTEMLSVLVECGYLIHPYEAKMLANPSFQGDVAVSIADAVLKYFRNMSVK